jgi:acyl-CoA thioesterase
MTDTTFASILERVEGATETFTLQLPEDWMQGRAGFGGLVAALALKAMRGHVPDDRKARSLMVSFIGPVGKGDFSIHTSILRSSKSVTHAEARVVQDESVKCVVLGSFGEDRGSVVKFLPPKRPDMPGPEGIEELPYIEGLTPAFSRHLIYRWALGDLPFSGSGGGEIGGWFSFRETADCLSEEWLVALADAWPTPVLSMLTAPAAASSLSWEMRFVHMDRPACSLDDWWCYHSIVDSAEKGYIHERAAIWDAAGKLAAFSRQTAAVFA